MSSVHAGVETPAAGAADRERVFFPSLDGYRAVAALAVLVNHVALLSGFSGRRPEFGQYLARIDVGVSVFFLLSGFLLYRPIVAARFAGRPILPIGTFLRRRALRIFPAYWFALVMVAFVLEAPGFDSPHEIWTHALLLHVYDIDQVTGGPIQQSWTLATELGFYALLPVYAWALGRRRRDPERQLRVEIVGVTALWVGPVTLKAVALVAGVDAEHYGMFGTWIPFRLDEFALGMAMAVASAWIGHRRYAVPDWVRRPHTTVASWLVAAAIFWYLSTQLDLDPFPLFTSRQAFVVRLLYSFTALFLLLPAIFGNRERGPVRALFENRVMIWLGLISYGIYIWHEAWQAEYLEWTEQPEFQTPFLGQLAAVTALTLLSGAVSWYLVERPALRLKRSRSQRLSVAD